MCDEWPTDTAVVMLTIQLGIICLVLIVNSAMCTTLCVLALFAMLRTAQLRHSAAAFLGPPHVLDESDESEGEEDDASVLSVGSRGGASPVPAD